MTDSDVRDHRPRLSVPFGPFCRPRLRAVLDVPTRRLADPLEGLRERAGARLRELRQAAGGPTAGAVPEGDLGRARGDREER
ncbi:hypothetical protein [Streptomyces durbertensis]|uniref:hypothetical protein n=1 Tax=Streptomyces durbertensis TaxID=2448886 RepID=UPI001600E54F|nr:hypothetical protein [Streptomyces durbertensis]